MAATDTVRAGGRAPGARHRDVLAVLTRPSSLVIAATLTAALLRLPFVGVASAWFDEVFTAHIVAAPLHEVWSRVAATEGTPPLYYWATWAWVQLQGGAVDIAWLRALGALAGVLAVLLIWRALRPHLPEPVALTAAWVVAISPFAAGWSVTARAYGLALVLAVLAVWAWLAVRERPTPARWALWALASLALIWTHWFGALLVGAQWAVLVARRPRGWRGAGIAALAIGAGVVPLLGLASGQAGDDRSDWIARTNLAARLGRFVREFALGAPVPSAVLELAGVALFVVGLGAGLWAARGALRRDDRLVGPAPGPAPLLADAAAVVAIALAVPVAAALLGIRDIVLARFAIVVWPLVVLIAAVGFFRLPRAVLVGFSVVAIVAAVWMRVDWRVQPADWLAARDVLSTRAVGAPLILYPADESPAAGYYVHRRPWGTMPRVERAWVVVAPYRTGRLNRLEPGVPPPGVPGPGFRRVDETDVRGFRLIEYRVDGPPRQLDNDELRRHPGSGAEPILLSTGN